MASNGEIFLHGRKAWRCEQLSQGAAVAAKASASQGIGLLSQEVEVTS